MRWKVFNVVLMALPAISVVAEDGHDTASFIEEVIVSSEHAETQLKESVNSVVVLRDIDIRHSTAWDISDIYERLPNVSVAEDGDIVVRGIDRHGVAGAVPNHANLFDGFWSPFSHNLFDLQHIEVMRGSETSFAILMGGATGFQPVTPTKNQGGRFRMALAPETEGLQIGIAQTAQITPELAVRGTFESSSGSGYVKNIQRNDDEWDDHEDYFGRVIVEWQPQFEKDTLIRLWAIHNKRLSGGSDLLAPVGTPDNPDPLDARTSINTGEFDRALQSNLAVRAIVEWSEHWTIDWLIGIAHEKQQSRSDFDPLSSGTSQLTQDNEWHFKASETRLHYDDGRNQVSFKAYVFDQANTRGYGTITNELIGGALLNLRYGWPTPHMTLAGLGGFATHQRNRWRFSYSLLADYQRVQGTRTFDSFRTGTTGDAGFDALLDTFIMLGFPQGEARQEVDVTTTLMPTASVAYDLNESVNLGANLKRSMRRGWLGGNPARATTVKYDKELSDSVELFVRSSFWDRRVLINATVFYSRITDQQVLVWLSDDFWDNQVVNADRSHTQGVELDLWLQTEWFSGWLGVSRLEAEYDDFKVTTPCCVEDWSGSSFANSPDWQFSGSLFYDPGDGLFAGFDFRWVGETIAGTGDNPTAVHRDDHLVVNARAGWRFAKGEVSLFARNLLDEEYLRFFHAEDRRARIGAPQEVGVTVDWSW